MSKLTTAEILAECERLHKLALDGDWELYTAARESLPLIAAEAQRLAAAVATLQARLIDLQVRLTARTGSAAMTGTV